MNMKEVSIIIPIYNVEKYVAECLNSVISQTYDHSKIEGIIVDDCTPDRSMDIVNGIIENYKGEMTFVLHKHEHNQGLSAARNSGMDIATGDYLYFMDSDDYIYPNAIELLMKTLRENPDSEIVSANTYDENHNYNIFNITGKRIIENINLLFAGNTKFLIAVNYLINRQFIKRIGVKFKRGIYFEDLLWNHQVLPLTSKVVIIPEITYFYRKNTNSIIHQAQAKKLNKSVFDHILILKSFIRELDNPIYVGKSVNTLILYMITYDSILSNSHLIDKSEQMLHQMEILRGYLMLSHIKNKRYILSMMTLLIYSPFINLKKYGWYRHKFNRIIEPLWRLAIVFDRFHKIK